MYYNYTSMCMYLSRALIKQLKYHGKLDKIAGRFTSSLLDDMLYRRKCHSMRNRSLENIGAAFQECMCRLRIIAMLDYQESVTYRMFTTWYCSANGNHCDNSTIWRSISIVNKGISAFRHLWLFQIEWCLCILNSQISMKKDLPIFLKFHHSDETQYYSHIHLY